MKRRDHEVLLALGSNIEPELHVPMALDRLRERFAVVAVSSRYRGPAVGGTGRQPDFVNLALRVRTDLTPRSLREACRRVEESCGRSRTTDRYAPRTLDVDVVLFDDLVLDLDGWRLPDPDLAERAHVLIPAAEVWPRAVHPTLRRSLVELLDDLPAAAVEALKRIGG